MLVTVLTRPGTSIADFVEGRNTGAVYEWTPGRRLSGWYAERELPGNNGLEVSPDQKSFYVVAFGWHAVVKFSRGNPAHQIRKGVAPDFMPDNIHWDGHRFIAAGMRYDEPACGGVRKVIAGKADDMRCHRGMSSPRSIPSLWTFIPWRTRSRIPISTAFRLRLSWMGRYGWARTRRIESHSDRTRHETEEGANMFGRRLTLLRWPLARRWPSHVKPASMVPIAGDPVITSGGKVAGTQLASGVKAYLGVRLRCAARSTIAVETAAAHQVGWRVGGGSQGAGVHPGAPPPQHQSLFWRGAHRRGLPVPEHLGAGDAPLPARICPSSYSFMAGAGRSALPASPSMGARRWRGTARCS